MSFLRAIWRILSGISRVITVLVPLIFVGIFIVAFSVSLSETVPEPLPERAGLLVAPQGRLVENRTPLEPVDALFAGGIGDEILLSSLVEAIESAATDERITSLVLDLEKLAGPSTSQAMEIIEAIDVFSASGKPVVAVGDYFSQAQYLLASQADEIILHPEGGLSLMGFGLYRTYLKQFLNNIRVKFHVFRAGDNKSAVEPYLRDDMSSQERIVVSQWLNSLWQDYTALVEAGRGKAEGEVTTFVDDFPARLEAQRGDLAKVFLAEGYVDALLSGEAMQARVSEIVDAVDEEGDAVFVSVRRYLDDVRQSPDNALPMVAVVPVEGTLVPGDSVQGAAGSDTIVEQLSEAAESGAVAIVIRINSGGGSVFASEEIRTKVQEISKSGLPVVASMSSAAASGGYWIAAEADQIWALPTTVTGSIGAFSVFPTIEGVYDYVGATVDGVGTTTMAGGFDPAKPLDESTRRIFQAVIDGVYREFLGLVARGRDMTVEEVDAIAGGKVWIGRQARDIGLVDELGGLNDAIAAAADLAEIERYEVARFGTPISTEQLIFEELGKNLQISLPTLLDSVLAWLSPLRGPLALVSHLKDPKHVYLQCFDCNYAGKH